MGSTAFTFVVCIFILQVVATKVQSAPHEGSDDTKQPTDNHLTNDITNNLQGSKDDSHKNDDHEKPVLLKDVKKIVEQMLLEERKASESQEQQHAKGKDDKKRLPNTPSKKESGAEDKTIDHSNKVSGDSAASSRNALSGAGHLETNEIVKNIHTEPKKTSTSDPNNKNQKVGSNKDSAEVESSKNLEKDKSEGNKLNSLQSTNDSATPKDGLNNKKEKENNKVELVKKSATIKINKNLKLDKVEGSRLLPDTKDSTTSKDATEEKFSQKHSELTSARAINLKKEEYTQIGNQNTQDSREHAEEHEEEGGKNTNEDQDQTGAELCECEDGCEGEEGTSDQGNEQKGDEQIEKNNSRLPYHILIKLKMFKATRIQPSPQLPPYPVEEVSDKFMPPRKLPTLAHVVLTRSRSTLENALPSPFGDNEDILRAKSDKMMMTGERMTGENCDDNGVNCRKTQDDNQGPFSSFAPIDQFLNTFNTNGDHGKTIRYFLFFKHLNEIIKAKARANAFRSTEESQAPTKFHFEESQNSPSPRLMFAAPNNQLAQHQLPPLYFPNDKSGYKIKHISNLSFGEFNQAVSQGERFPSGTISYDQNEGNNDFVERPNYSSNQELPQFIKNIIAHLARRAGEGGFQPIPTKPMPRQAPAEEGNPLLYKRAVLAPFALF